MATTRRRRHTTRSRHHRRALRGTASQGNTPRLIRSSWLLCRRWRTGQHRCHHPHPARYPDHEFNHSFHTVDPSDPRPALALSADTHSALDLGCHHPVAGPVRRRSGRRGTSPGRGRTPLSGRLRPSDCGRISSMVATGSASGNRETSRRHGGAAMRTLRGAMDRRPASYDRRDGGLSDGDRRRDSGPNGISAGTGEDLARHG